MGIATHVDGKLVAWDGKTAQHLPNRDRGDLEVMFHELHPHSGRTRVQVGLQDGPTIQGTRIRDQGQGTRDAAALSE